MKRIALFSGNRAEFGILFPIIEELSRYYLLDIILSGAHVLPQWNTCVDAIKQLDDAGIRYSLYKIDLSLDDNTYVASLGEIYGWCINYYKKNHVDYAMVLGDRVESFGFALASFYSRIPLIHFCGGDVVEVSNFDTNVRHSITKISNYHMVTSESSREVVLQLGEEDIRVLNIGNPSFDYERIGYLTSKEELSEKYSIKENDTVGIVTFHPSTNRSDDENLDDFIEVYEAVLDSDLTKVFITYPNNDPGYEKIVNYIQNISDNQRIRVVKSFGTFNYLGIMNGFKALLVGNSSSGLLETPYYMVPVINVGDRQRGRIRGNNVFDCDVSKDKIKSVINYVIDNYDILKESFSKNRYIFGDGKAALKVREFMKTLDQMKYEDKMFKKFIVR